MKWDVWTQWNILIWAHSTFSHIDIPVAFGRLWVLSNVSIPLCWPRPNASLWRWMPWPFLWMRWGCLHRAFFRPYHVFSVTSLVPFKGQGKARSDLHTRRLNPFFFSRWFQRRDLDACRNETEGLCSDCAICRDLSSTKDSNRGDLMGIWIEASIFCATIWGGMGLGLTWVGGRRGFWSSKFFFLVSTWQTEKNWSQVENQGFGPDSGSEEWYISSLVGVDPSDTPPQKTKKNTSHQTGKGKNLHLQIYLKMGIC